MLQCCFDFHHPTRDSLPEQTLINMSANYSLPDIKAANAAWAPEYKPVIVITGSTAGIGKSTLETFARHLKGRPAHFVMVGRNKVAAQKIIDSIKSDEGAEQFTIDFFAVDLTLNASAHDLAKELTSKVDKINFLVLSAGTVMLVGGRNETTEGIDIHLATRYYTRWVLTNDLLPLLRNARQAGEPAHMLSVLGPGHHDHIDLNNLGVKTGYGGLKAMYETCTYNDLMVAVSFLFPIFLSFVYSRDGMLLGVWPSQSRHRVYPLQPSFRQHHQHRDEERNSTCTHHHYPSGRQACHHHRGAIWREHDECYADRKTWHEQDRPVWARDGTEVVPNGEERCEYLVGAHSR